MFSNKLFGRISTRYKNEKAFTYYLPGVLHNIPFKKIKTNKLIIGTTGFIDFDPILKYCDKFITSSVSSVCNDFITGKEFWKKKAEQRGFKIDFNKK